MTYIGTVCKISYKPVYLHILANQRRANQL